MFTKKIKPRSVTAFTILEVTVAMIIATIVVMVSYNTYYIILKGYAAIAQKNEALSDLIRFDQLLKKDIEQSELLVQSDAGLVIQKKGSQVSYLFNPDAVIRKSIIKDTFQMEIVEKSILFENRQVTGLTKGLDSNPLENLLNTTIERARIDEILLIIRFQDELIPHVYKKKYSSYQLMQRNEHVLH